MGEISWCKGDDHNAVATSFAAQHNIMSDEIPAVLDFLAHAEQHAATAAAPTAAAHAEQNAAAVAASAPATAKAEDAVSGKMDVTPASQDAPVYTVNNDG